MYALLKTIDTNVRKTFFNYTNKKNIKKKALPFRAGLFQLRITNKEFNAGFRHLFTDHDLLNHLVLAVCKDHSINSFRDGP